MIVRQAIMKTIVNMTWIQFWDRACFTSSNLCHPIRVRARVRLHIVEPVPSKHIDKEEEVIEWVGRSETTDRQHAEVVIRRQDIQLALFVGSRKKHPKNNAIERHRRLLRRRRKDLFTESLLHSRHLGGLGLARLSLEHILDGLFDDLYNSTTAESQAGERRGRGKRVRHGEEVRWSQAVTCCTI